MDIFTSSSSSSEDGFIIALLNEERKRKRRRYWVHPTLERRGEHGGFHRLIEELKLHHENFHQYFRMSVSEFECLLQLVAPSLTRSETKLRKPIDPEQRLAVCLRFLSTGDSYNTIASSFLLGISTVAGIVGKTCDAIWQCLKNEHMPEPTEEMWRNTARRFQDKLDFPNCLGAMNGKQILIQAPANSGSYKGRFSVVLLALVDADCRFLAVDVGSYGSNSDGDVFSHSELGKALRDGTFNVPPPTELPGAPELGKVNHVLVVDKAFPLKAYLLRPYPGRHPPLEKIVFNYRLSRVRLISENCFSNLSLRFRVFQRRLQFSPSVVESVVKAACILSNYLQSSEPSQDEPPVEDSCVSKGMLQALRCWQGNRSTAEAQNTRDTFKNYFNSPAGQAHEHVHSGLEAD